MSEPKASNKGIPTPPPLPPTTGPATINTNNAANYRVNNVASNTAANNATNIIIASTSNSGATSSIIPPQQATPNELPYAVTILSKAPPTIAYAATNSPQPRLTITHRNHPRANLNEGELLDLITELMTLMEKINDRRVRMDTIRPLNISGTLELVPISPLATWWLHNIIGTLNFVHPLAIMQPDEQDPMVRRLIRLSDVEIDVNIFWNVLSTYNPNLTFGRWEIIPNSERHFPDRHQIQLALRLPRSQADLVTNNMNGELSYTFPTRIKLIDPNVKPIQSAKQTIGCRKRKNSN